MTEYLLDVNVLLALFDVSHVNHNAAHRWFAKHRQDTWVSCPITENGFVRVASHPSYPNRPGDATDVLLALEQFCRTTVHAFWPDDISLRGTVSAEALLTHGQLTDVYLLALAAHHDGKLASFDRRIPVKMIRGGADALHLIAS